ncbi:thiol-disulfide isomerase/thioredoxin [Filimonas zeae]|uniref:Thiol:disulfide interchange protein n=1 Tax=Filimonas zeae TaxID=1737353 RepID=A0A917IS58_9BACT|nr:TlpA disulfide reductase family protein [Filimonas zeae]MDR6338116.1 thiol-disulfide isomerase/thioredoxin [Filimonas zeae]GGH61801.1 thiol:disulfide interchange protein [Filimonas zeae]
MYHKIVLFLGSSCLLAMSYAQPRQKGFVLSGTTNGKATGLAYLEDAAERKWKDSVEIQNGAFVFRTKLPHTGLYNLRIEEGVTQVFVENTAMQMVIDVKELYRPKVKGAVSDSLYREFWKRFLAYNEENLALNQRINKMMQKSKPGMPEYILAEDSAKVLEDRFHIMLKKFITDFPASAVAAYAIDDRLINYGDYTRAAMYYKLLQPAAQQSYYGTRVQKALAMAAKTAIGATVRIAQPDTAGKLVKLPAYTAKYTLIDFWASWCGPCRRENPNVVQAYRKYHDKGFDIISISLDDKKDAWMKAIYKDSLTWTHVSDLNGWKNAAAQQYGIRSVPTSVLVDKNGKIVAKDLRGEALHKELEKLLM